VDSTSTGGYMLTQNEIDEAEQLARRYGPANCWTGTSGTLAAWIIRLIYDNQELNRQIAALCQDQNERKEME
jgi:hypothetical protein